MALFRKHKKFSNVPPMDKPGAVGTYEYCYTDAFKRRMKGEK